MTVGTLCFERLQVIHDDVPRDGALNMALDETLLESSAGVPLLRFYLWVRPTVSFGYFDPLATARAVARGREVVRRLTGGGIVEHGEDLTYSLVAPREDAFMRLRPVETYRMIHAAVALSLARGGFTPKIQDDPLRKPVSDGHPNACFDRPVLHDLMANGQKVAGGAQRRNRGGLLHQGSIRLGSDGNQYGSPWQDAVRRALPPALAHSCELRMLTTDEIFRAETLAAAKYATPAWTDRV